MPHFIIKHMKKFLIVFFLVVFSLVLVSTANAASTIGTNMSTTGTLTVTPASNSATSVRFQNAAGTSYFIADSTNSRIGVGGAPFTTFEVQGTASASYLMTANSIQVSGGGAASVAYSRFGIGATGHSLAATDDVLFTGLVEFDDNVFFDARVGIGGTGPSTALEVQGTASASYFFTQNTIQVAGVPGATASVAYSRFGIDTTGHSLAAADDVLFTGLVEFNDNVFFDSRASVATAFEVTGSGYASASTLFATTNVVVGNRVASSSTTYVAEFGNNKTGTASFYFGGGNSATLGTCFQLKSTTGAWIYMRFEQGALTPTLSAIRCHTAY